MITMKRKQKEKDKKPEKVRMTIDGFFEDELPFLADVVGFCGNLPMSVYANSTVVKSPEVVFRGLAFSRNRFLSEEYLLNFRRSEPELGTVVGVNNFRLPMVMGALAARKLKETPENLFRLPDYKKITAPLGAVIRSRRSIRSYRGRTMPLEDLASLLYYGQGISGKLDLQGLPPTVTLGAEQSIDVRNAPSGGGLYPIDLYVIALNIEGLERAAYLYLPEHHALKRAGGFNSSVDVARLAQFGEIEVSKASLLLAYVYKLLDNSRKYGDSGLAYALIEAGEISENIHLTATALGIGPCDVGGYAKHRLEQVLGLDGLSAHVVHLTVLGS